MNTTVENLQKHAKACIAGIQEQQLYLESMADLPLKRIAEATEKIRAYEDSYNLINYMLQLKEKIDKVETKKVALVKPLIIQPVN